jgi:hypothetical protein
MPQNYRTTLDEASILISSFISAVPDIAEKVAVGASLNPLSLYGEPEPVPRIFRGLEIKNLLPVGADSDLYNGHMGWFCWNDFGTGAYPKFFLSFEQNDSYRQGTEAEFPDMRKLKCPLETFAFPAGTKDVKQWFSTHTIDPNLFPNQYKDEIIKRQDVMQFARNFKGFGPGDKDGSFNKFSFSFFENESTDDVAAFLKTPELKYIRYYFGLDNSNQLKTSNRIRVILVAVDKDGKNIVTNDRLDRIVMLQHSWPPPPWN